jgi:hypothetical protein
MAGHSRPTVRWALAHHFGTAITTRTIAPTPGYFATGAHGCPATTAIRLAVWQLFSLLCGYRLQRGD